MDKTSLIMKTYLVVFRLPHWEKDRTGEVTQKFFEVLKSFDDWRPADNEAFFIRSDLSAKEISQKFEGLGGKGGLLYLVIEVVPSNASGYSFVSNFEYLGLR